MAKILGNEELSILKQKSPFSLPDNPSDKGLSASQIKAKFYEGLFALYGWLKQTQTELSLCEDSLKEIANGDIVVGKSDKAYKDENGNNIIETYQTKLEALNALNALIQSLTNGDLVVAKSDSALTDSDGNIIKDTYISKAGAIVDNLDSIETNKSLSARQGKVLKEFVDELTATTIKESHIIDDLEHTDTNKPLSANQGREIKVMLDAINELLHSDNIDLDTVQEIVDYIEANKTLIDSITTTKVNVGDIIDNLDSAIVDKPLSANQGKVLNDKIGDIDAILDFINGEVISNE